MELPELVVRRIVQEALREDLGWGDITTRALISAEACARGAVLFKEAGVLAGLPVMALTFQALDEEIAVRRCVPEGAWVEAGQVVAEVQGRAAPILSAERVALNFLQRMCGIATQTRRYTQAIKGLPVRIIDTRKTTPGLRMLEKYAVRMGGGANHRFNLSDGVLIKDNHLAILRAQGLGLREIVETARRGVPHTAKVQVEVRTPEEAVRAVEAGAEAVLLDNMSLVEMRRAVKLVARRALVEASGGVTLENVREIAETGVDLISSGALTHSARALDISLELEG